MRLRQLIEGITIRDFQGNPDAEIQRIYYDSRSVEPGGGLFVALRGHGKDGHNFIQDALKRGAVAVMSEAPVSETRRDSAQVSVIQVTDSRRALSRVAVRFFEIPFERLNIVGITGTNGKTTTTYLLESILAASGRDPGVIGTINYRFAGHVLEAPVTTPESLELMEILRRMADSGIQDVVMEVSSHSLEQGRVADCPFRVAVFTNMSRDHLDYHPSMEAYFEAKSRLFRPASDSRSPSPPRAVINVDDPKGRELIQLTAAQVMTYGMGSSADIRAQNVRVHPSGLTARLITPDGEVNIVSVLLGSYDIYNIMAAAGTALSIGIGLDAICAGIRLLKGVPGRLELVRNSRELFLIVDYAHTPDALSKALEAVRLLTKGRVIVVFGCGGDRDRGKRMEMGRVAGMKSDKVCITSDNPRSEDPESIARQIEAGLMESGFKDYCVELDRRHAIGKAIGKARKGDVVLIAGKGHETYQIVGAEKRSFDDRLVAAEALNNGA